MKGYKMQDTRCRIQVKRFKNHGSCIMHHTSEPLNQKGIALVMVLILSAIVLAIISGLIYMITSTTQISGMQKRYKTALEAGIGGAEITYQFIALGGDQNLTNELKNDLSSLIPLITTSTGCTGIDISNNAFTGLEAKLRTPTTTWSNCDNTMTIIPGIATSYDMQFELGMNPTYTVYTKIVDTIEGNSGGGEELSIQGVVSSGEITVVSIPYLFTVEVNAENAANPSERAKLSILYQY